jgi:choloylglycine hydrolase
MSRVNSLRLIAINLVTLLCCHLLSASQSLACSTFSYSEQGHSFVGKSYDWDKEQGVLHVNKRGVKKSALQVFPTDRPLTWTAKYGSLTLNQYGRELPNAGINEAGLVVEVMVLGGAKFPAPDEKLTVNESQWVQYMLDMAGSANDVAVLTRQARLSKILIPLHYMACDPSGACIAVEPIDGEMVITDLSERGNKVMTNDSFENGMKYLKGFEGFGGSRPIPTSKGSLDRFVIASDHIKRANSLTSQDGVKFGFEGIERVASAATKWRVVYDLDARSIYFATQSETNVKKANLSEFDFNCRTAVKVYDMAARSSGDVSSKFTDYSSKDNSQLVRSSLGRSVPEALLQAAESLPESTECVQ